MILLSHFFRRSDFNLILMIFLICVAWSLIETAELPDYFSYLSIFENPKNYFNDAPGFKYLIWSASLFVSYEQFRFIQAILGLSMLLYSYNNEPKNYIFPAFFFILVVFLEFYLVRLRSGLAIFVFYGAMLCYIRSHKGLGFLFWVFSLTIHPPTALVLSAVYAPVNIFAAKAIKTKLVLQTFLWLVILWAVDFLSDYRGPKLVSDVNPVRVFALLVFPLLVFAILENFKKQLSSIDFEEIIASMSVSVAFLILWAFGLFDQSGEAVVRLLSLVFGPSLLIGYLWKSGSWSANLKLYAQLVLGINSLFFINTVYLKL